MVWSIDPRVDLDIKVVITIREETEAQKYSNPLESIFTIVCSVTQFRITISVL